MDNKRNKKKRILLLLLMLFATTSLLTASTFAWFTANKTVTVSEIQVNVEAQGGIQISADGTKWRSVIGAAELISVGSTSYTSAINQIPTTLEPVSTARTMNTSGLMEMYYGTITTNTGGDYILTAVEDVETHGTSGKFIAFDLFFRADAPTDLYLTTNSRIITDDQTDTGIKNAARIAFVNKGNTAVGSSIETIQGLNSGTTSPTYLWEPNYDSHTAPAISHAHDTYEIDVLNGDGVVVPYSGVADEVTVANNVLVGDATATDYPALFTAITPNYTTVAGFSTNIQVFSLLKGISKIRIYMWVEGQDVDCENAASGGRILYNIQFTNEPPQP